MAFSGTASGGGSGATRADVGHAVLFAGAAALGGFLFGYDTAVINGAVGADRTSTTSAPRAPGSRSH